MGQDTSALRNFLNGNPGYGLEGKIQKIDKLINQADEKYQRAQALNETIFYRGYKQGLVAALAALKEE